MVSIQKILANPSLMIIILVIVVIIISLSIFLYHKGIEKHEGFYPVTEERINFEREVGKRRYNDFADMVDPEKNGVIVNGKIGDELIQNVLGTPDYESDYNNKSLAGPTYSNELKYKALPADSEVIERIRMCEGYTKWDCNALSNPLFNKYCGICTAKGEDHLGNPHIGGLYIDPKLKEKSIKEANESGSAYKSAPSAGKCKGEFILERPYCDTQKDRDDCANAASFNDPNAIAKCALCANAPGGNRFVYIGKRGNQDTNYALTGNPLPYKVRLRFAVTHPKEATITVLRSSDQKQFVGSFIGGSNTYMVDLPNAFESEKYNIIVSYPVFLDHKYTEEEYQRIKNGSNPTYAALTGAMYGPVVDGDSGFLQDDPRAVDVSDFIKNKYKITDCSKMSVAVSTSALGTDPAPGITKQLRLIYSSNGIDNAYSYGTDGTTTNPINTGNLKSLCPDPVKPGSAEQQVCENDEEGNPYSTRIYTGGRNSSYPGVSPGVKCIETAPAIERGIVGIWESVGKVPRQIPIDLSVLQVNGYDINDEGLNKLGTIKGSKQFKNLVNASQALGIPPNLFWFWAKKSTESKCDFTVQVPATLRDPTVADDLKLCPSGPLIATLSAAQNLRQGACEKYLNGVQQGPGNFSDDCIRSLFLSSGCTKQGKGYPNTPSKIAAFTKDSLTQSNNTIDIINDAIKNTHTIATTGSNSDGLKVDHSTYVNANIDCFGVSLSNPCDTPFKETGPHSPDCLDYLFRNAGKSEPTIGQTYPGMFNRSSGTDRLVNTPIMFCQRAGTMAPIGTDGKVNMEAVATANSYGSVNEIRDFYKQIHYDANLGKDPSGQQRALLQCYGVGVKSPKPVCKGVYAQFVCIRPSMRIDNIIQISQIEVYDVNGKVVSTNAKTTSSVPLGGSSNKAPVDGRSKIRETPDMFISENDTSMNKDKSFWMVNLGAMTEISHVIYYNRATNQQRSVGMRLQLLDSNQVLVREKTLVGGSIETIQFSNIKPAGLLRTGDKISLNPSKFSGSSMTIVAGGELLIMRGTGTAGTAANSFIALPGNAPKPDTYSFKHATSEKYLRVQGFRVRVSEDDRTNAFKNETSFNVVDSLAGNPGEVSYESVSNPGNYLGVTEGMGLYITQIDSPAKKIACSWVTVNRP